MPNDLSSIELGDAVLPRQRGRRPEIPAPVVVRQLTEEDLPSLLDASRQPANPLAGIAKIRYSHHQIAQLLVKGLKATEVALITGYTPARIQQLQNDPSFQELLAHYQHQREAIFVDVLERMKALGLNSLDELQERLENDPDGWTNREIMELAKLMLLEPAKTATSGTTGGGPSTQLTVTFVNASPATSQQLPLIEQVGPTFDD